MAIAAESAVAVAACSTQSEDGSRGATANGLDGRDPSASPSDKVSCADHFDGDPETLVDLGGVNRVLTADGVRIEVFDAQPGGPNWRFKWKSNVPVIGILIRSANQVTEVDDTFPATEGEVTRAEADGHPGLNRIGFCFFPPRDAGADAGDAGRDAGQDAGRDAGPKPPRDGGKAW